ncbi:MAG: DUF1367 family protein [Burkholderiales bacterium]
MAACEVYKDECGKLQGFGEKGGRAWLRFIRAVRGLAVGNTLHFEWWEPRSPGFHKRHFVLLHAIFDQQDNFVDFDSFRMWTTVGAGECMLLPGPHGKPVAIPKSIKYHKLDEVEFQELHLSVVRFLRSVHATRCLWPMMTDLQADELMDNLLVQFGT